MKYYNKDTKAFSLDYFDGCVNVEDEYWQFILNGESKGKVRSSDENGFPVLIDPPKPDFKDQQSAALASVDSYHAKILQNLVANPPQAEKDTWPLKLEIANAITNGSEINESGLAFLTAAGKLSDDDKKIWAASVLNKAKKYAEYVGLAEKLRANARAAVKAATTEEELTIAMEEQKSIAQQMIESLKQS